ncbi:hypothetical protein BGZ63DRAFT_367257 [Mariannaea sp. PMI_226]|nr:hypothetical protein BGZ63DRAFT_367257 [Mariannaea sp. PMI_226]
MITSTLDHNVGLSERKSLAQIILFCSARAWRGNVRILLQASAILFTFFIIFGLMPEHLDGTSLSGYKDVLTWSDKPRPQANLRIVVFGSPDVAGSAVDPAKQRTTWTEELCNQMNCISHVSLVPSGHGLASNRIYAHELSELRDITEKTDIIEKPALDYDFIGEQYPVPHNVPDFAEQVKQFLAMPPPKPIPRETIWVFTFGSWEIWNLAAMPQDTAEKIITTTAKAIFDQIELLYTAALDAESPAHSDFWSNATDSQIVQLTNPETIKDLDVRTLESFRILIPKLFDITITPGWGTRLPPTFPGSRSEHTRNALRLIRCWNQAMEYRLNDWQAKGARKPAGNDDSDSKEAGQIGPRSRFGPGNGRGGTWQQQESLFDWLPASLQPKALNHTRFNDNSMINASYPYRNGLHIDITESMLDAMTEEDMQRAEVHDSEGHGTLERDDSRRYLNVWTPCVKPSTNDLAVDMDSMTVGCSVPNDHLFHDPFTLSNRAIVSLGPPMYDEVMSKLFVQQPKNSWFY